MVDIAKSLPTAFPEMYATFKVSTIVNAYQTLHNIWILPPAVLQIIVLFVQKAHHVVIQVLPVILIVDIHSVGRYSNLTVSYLPASIWDLPRHFIQ